MAEKQEQCFTINGKPVVEAIKCLIEECETDTWGTVTGVDGVFTFTPPNGDPPTSWCEGVPEVELVPESFTCSTDGLVSGMVRNGKTWGVQRVPEHTTVCEFEFISGIGVITDIAAGTEIIPPITMDVVNPTDREMKVRIIASINHAALGFTNPIAAQDVIYIKGDFTAPAGTIPDAVHLRYANSEGEMDADDTYHFVDTIPPCSTNTYTLNLYAGDAIEGEAYVNDPQLYMTAIGSTV